MALVLPYAVVGPYSTCESRASAVVDAIVAPDVVRADAVTPRSQRTSAR